jgi:MEMO1 family protein
MASVRVPAVAGSFYPNDPEQLRNGLNRYLEIAQGVQGAVVKNEQPPKALIVPHAGYIYSAPIAASAYVKLHALKDIIKRVVLLGPCHRVPVGGLALCSAQYFETPLGRIPVDKELSKKIAKMPQVFTFDATHVEEHSLEVHLPFLQTVLSDFSLLPIVVGQASPKEVSDVLEQVWGGPETLIVISTDLSHYLDYETAQSLDRRTTKAIETFDLAQIGNNQACGRIPLKGLLESAKLRGMDITTLDVRNSGDTAGSHDRVVGYGAWMLSGGQQPSAEEAFSYKLKAILQRHGTTLLRVAAASIKRGISHNAQINVDLSSFPDSLQEKGACFVTLERKDGSLRGCIGSLEAYQPLAKDCAENAFKAGFMDPRFPKLNAGELSGISIHISVLSPSFPMSFKDEADLLSQLRPNIDGLIIQDRGKRALFLPSVWEKIASKEDFLKHLKMKAGMTADHWSPTFSASRFITEGVHSEELDSPQLLWQDNPSS